VDELYEIAEALLPGVRLDGARVAEDGNIHDVLLVPGVAAVRVSRRPLAAASMPRRVAVLRVLGSMGLPFAVPVPLTPVTAFGDRAAVAVSWVDGSPLAEGEGTPGQVAEVLRAVREVPLTSELLAVLDQRAQGPSWSDLLVSDVLSRLPERWLPVVRESLDALLAIEPVPDTLVHGDLGASNVHWSSIGDLVGVVDWDLAMPGDPAIDTALMAYHGWDTVRQAVSPEEFVRARAWDAVVGVEHLVALMNGRPLTSPEGFVRAVVAWLERQSSR